MVDAADRYYQGDLARIHHEGYGFHADAFERHDNVLIDAATIPSLLEAAGLCDVEVGPSFGSETNMVGLVVVNARRPA